MQKTMKIVTILLIVMMLLFSASTCVRATSGDAGEGGTGGKADSIITQMEGQEAGEGSTKIAEFGGKVADILTTAGIVVAVIVLLVLGIKYMMGSASEKAEYKKTMIPYLVGAILILGASTIVKAIFSFTF